MTVITLLWLAGCTQPNALDRIQQEEVLHVVTHPASTVYFEERGEPAGFEYSLARRFADYLGVELRVEVVESLPELFNRVEEGHTHFAAAGLGLTPELKRRYRHGPVYKWTRPIVVYNSAIERPEALEDLTGKSIRVRAGGPHEQLLRGVRERHPGIDWQTSTETEPTELLNSVNEGEMDITIIGSNELSMNKVFFPRIRESFSLSSPMPVAWLFPDSEDGLLMQQARDFFLEQRTNGGMAKLEERYYGHLDRMDYVGARTFTYHLDRRLPDYRDIFKAAARAHGLDWRLLAAIGYQESHWRPGAVSPTGVRGLMMLTRKTAAHLGIKNRVDPQASIWGGARYFKQLRERIPDSITEPDRTWFALASYNVGFGHVLDARRLTKAAGRHPDQWLHVKKFLPRLAQRQYYTQTRYGYARGYEPVIYTQNIRRYYDVLKWMFPSDTQERQFAETVESPLSDEPSPREMEQRETTSPADRNLDSVVQQHTPPAL